MAFIEKSDLYTNAYQENIDLITRNDDTLIEKACRTAEGELKNYLSRFDYADMLGKTDTDRDDLLLDYGKDIAMWKLIKLANPEMDVTAFLESYRMTKETLEDIQVGKITPPDWPLADSDSAASTFFHASSNTRRPTRW